MDAYITLLWFVAGLIVGWLVEFFIDWRFWRRTLLSSELTQVAEANELVTLRQKVAEYQIRIEELENRAGRASSISTEGEGRPLTEDEMAVSDLSTLDQPVAAAVNEAANEDSARKHVGAPNVTE